MEQWAPCLAINSQPNNASSAMLTGNDTLRLVPHPKARDQAISIKNLEAGSLILSTPFFATVLLATQKGHRCDACFRLPADGTSLRRCTGCGSYWYCDVDCSEFQISFRIIAYPYLQVKLSNGMPIISGYAKTTQSSLHLQPFNLSKSTKETIPCYCLTSWLICHSCRRHTRLSTLPHCLYFCPSFPPPCLTCLFLPFLPSLQHHR